MSNAEQTLHMINIIGELNRKLEKEKAENEKLKEDKQKLIESLKLIQSYSRSNFENETNKCLCIEEVATYALNKEERKNGN